MEHKDISICLEKCDGLDKISYYLPIFKKYRWEKEAFRYVFREKVSIYNELLNKYGTGRTNITKLPEDNSINYHIKKRVENYIYRDYIKVTNGYLRKTRYDIAKYLAESKASYRTIDYKLFLEAYTSFIIKHKLSLEELSLPDRFYETHLSRYSWILRKPDKRIRYFDIDKFNIDKLIHLLKLSEIGDCEISINIIYKKYATELKELDIRDEYELYNIIVKANMNDYGIIVQPVKMPILIFGNGNRVTQVEQLFLQEEPIKKDKLARLYENKYGVRREVVMNSYFDCINCYLVDGIYKSNFQTLTKKEIKLLKSNLSDNFYLYTEFIKIYKKLLPKAKLKKINSKSINDLGFKITNEIIYKQKFSSCKQCIKNTLQNYEVLDLYNGFEQYLDNSYFNMVVGELCNEYVIIEFMPKQYINIKKLRKSGIYKKDIYDYTQAVKKFVNNRYFTFNYLYNRGFKHKLDELGFGNFFYESLVIKNPYFNTAKVNGVYLYKATKEDISIGGLIETIVIDKRNIDIFDLVDLLSTDYGLNIERSRLIKIAQEQDLYYDSIMEKVYVDYDEYFEEV